MQDKERIYRVVTSTKDNSGEVNYKPTVPDPLAASYKNRFYGYRKRGCSFMTFMLKLRYLHGSNKTKTFDAANEREEESSDIIITDRRIFQHIQISMARRQYQLP